MCVSRDKIKKPAFGKKVVVRANGDGGDGRNRGEM